MKIPFTREQAAGLPIAHASYSSVLQYHSNLQLFMKTYVRNEWDIKGTPSATVGTCAHKYAELRLSGSDELTALAESNLLFDSMVNDAERPIDWWKTGTPEASKAELAIACSNVERVLESIGRQWLECESSESSITVPIYDKDGEAYPVPLKAKIDAVFSKDGNTSIVDWKFLATYSEEGETNPKYELQAGAYWLALSSEWTPPDKCQFVEIKKKEPSLVCKADPTRKLLQADLRALCDENGIAWKTYDKNSDLSRMLADAWILVKEPVANVVTYDLSEGYASIPVRAFLTLFERFLVDFWYRTNYDLPVLVNVSDEYGKGKEAYEDMLKEMD